jgi:hypothetical protein
MRRMGRFAWNAYATELRNQAQIGTWAYAALQGTIRRRQRLVRRVLGIFETTKGAPGPKEAAEIERLSRKAAVLTIRLLMYLQTFLASAGIISTLLWPSSKRGTPAEVRARSHRAEELRRIAGAGKEMAIRFKPGGLDDVRGALLHIDEMIDDVVVLHPGERVEVFGIGGAAGAGLPPASWSVRSLDEDAMILRVMGRESKLKPQAIEMMAILMALRQSSRVSILKLSEASSQTGKIAFSWGTASGPVDPRRTS